MSAIRVTFVACLLSLNLQAAITGLTETPPCFFPPGMEGEALTRALVETNEAGTTGKETHFTAFQGNSGSRLWPRGVVPYEFEEGLSERLRTTSSTAFTTYLNSTGARFIPRDGQEDYIVVQMAPAANAPSSAQLGKIGGRQTVVLNPNADLATVIHELGHILGLVHEHQRADRDEYVWVNLQNLPETARLTDFAIVSGGTGLSDYDVTSIMHYPSSVFASDRGSRILRLDGTTIPRNLVLSESDIRAVGDIVRQAGGESSAAIPMRGARIQVSLPAQASLTVDGNATTSTGDSRLLTTPPLEIRRDFSYTLAARLQVNGAPVTREQRVRVRAGQTTNVDFTRSFND